MLAWWANRNNPRSGLWAWLLTPHCPGTSGAMALCGVWLKAYLQYLHLRLTPQASDHIFTAEIRAQCPLGTSPRVLPAAGTRVLFTWIFFAEIAPYQLSPLCLCPTSLPGQNFQAFLGTILSVLAFPVPNCWQIACFDFIVSGLQDLSFGTKSPGTSGATSLASSFCSLLPCFPWPSLPEHALQSSSLSGQLSSGWPFILSTHALQRNSFLVSSGATLCCQLGE